MGKSRKRGSRSFPTLDESLQPQKGQPQKAAAPAPSPQPAVPEAPRTETGLDQPESTGSPSDLGLWHAFTRTIRRLAPTAAQKPSESEAASGAASGADTPPASPPLPDLLALPKPPSATRAAPRDLAVGRVVDVDKATAQRFRRGDLPIDARLDLHGMTQERAHDALVEFLLRAQDRGARCVLVITGKGSLYSGTGPELQRHDRGVLKRAVPRWLNAPPLRPIILAISEAQPRHGGSGALYILLKRQR